MTSTSTVRSSGDSTYLESGPAASPWKSVSNPIVKRWAASRCSIEAQLLAEAVHSDSMLTELQAVKMRADKQIEFQRLKDAELKDAELKDAELKAAKLKDSERRVWDSYVSVSGTYDILITSQLSKVAKDSIIYEHRLAKAAKRAAKRARKREPLLSSPLLSPLLSYPLSYSPTLPLSSPSPSPTGTGGNGSSSAGNGGSGGSAGNGPLPLSLCSAGMV